MVIAVGITIARVQPSFACGPFRSIECGPLGQTCVVYDYVVDLLMDHTDQTLKAVSFSHELHSFYHYSFMQILLFMGKPTFLWPVALVLVLILYFYWAYGNAQFNLIVELRTDLIAISKDKALLLQDFKSQQEEEFLLSAPDRALAPS